MMIDEISQILAELTEATITQPSPDAWQVETPTTRLLILLTEDQQWLRALVPIAPVNDIQPFLAQLLEANFDTTQEARYAISEGILWGIFQHRCDSLTASDLQSAIQQLLIMQQQAIEDSFSRHIETQVRLIIRAAKQQGQSLEKTLQNLERFYAEGIMGDLDDSAATRQETLGAWRYQLERLWNQVDPQT